MKKQVANVFCRKNITSKIKRPSSFASIYEDLKEYVNGLSIFSEIFHISCGNVQFDRQYPQVSVFP
jgi:hypothetical protein